MGGYLVAGVSAAVLFASIASSAAATDTINPTPVPTGSYAVGRTAFDWIDQTRSDPDSASGQREIVVWVWYPAAPRPGAKPAQWLPGKWGELFWSRFLRQYPDAASEATKYPIQGIVTHAYADAPIKRAANSYPVLLFAPGFGEVPLSYQTLMEDLASHGYVVAGIVPTSYSGFTVFADGRAVEDPSRNVFAIAQAAHQVIVADLGFTLTQLEKLSADGNSAFAGRLALDRVGAFGHSIGGSAAIQLAAEDARVRTAIDIDGTLLGSAARGASGKPILVMNSGGGSAMSGIYDTALSSAKPGYRVVLVGSTHAFSQDLGLMPFLPPSARHAAQNSQAPAGTPPPSAGAPARGGLIAPGGGPPGGGMLMRPPLLGSIDPTRALAITRVYVGAFFGEYLQGESGGLLRGPSSAYPEISFAKGAP
jgi:predicted dienelactone hydrolase